MENKKKDGWDELFEIGKEISKQSVTDESSFKIISKIRNKKMELEKIVKEGKDEPYFMAEERELMGEIKDKCISPFSHAFMGLLEDISKKPCTLDESKKLIEKYSDGLKLDFLDNLKGHPLVPNLAEKLVLLIAYVKGRDVEETRNAFQAGFKIGKGETISPISPVATVTATSCISHSTQKIEEVREVNGGYEVKRESGWLHFIDKKYKLEPKVGDTMEVYGDIGRPIQGICINGKTLFFKGELQLEDEHNKWKEKTQKEYDQRYKELMREIKDEESFITVDISGMGGGYERSCQLMLRAGIEYLKDKPDFVWDYKKYENIYGICWSDSEQANELDKVLMDATGEFGCTGAMHQCVISHLSYIHKNGYDKWLEDCKDRQYTYPQELPNKRL